MTARITVQSLSERIDRQGETLDAILAALSARTPALVTPAPTVTVESDGAGGYVAVVVPSVVSAPVLPVVSYVGAVDNSSLARVLREQGIHTWSREEWIGHKVAAGLRAPEQARKAAKKAPRKGRKSAARVRAGRKAASSRRRDPKTGQFRKG